MPKISRRTALRRGGQAVAVAAAFPIAGIPANAAGGDTEVFKAYEEWQRLEKAASDADTEADVRHNAVQGLLPPKPQRLSVSTAKEGTPEWDRLLAAFERGRTITCLPFGEPGVSPGAGRLTTPRRSTRRKESCAIWEPKSKDNMDLTPDARQSPPAPSPFGFVDPAAACRGQGRQEARKPAA